MYMVCYIYGSQAYFSNAVSYEILGTEETHERREDILFWLRREETTGTHLPEVQRDRQEREIE